MSLQTTWSWHDNSPKTTRPFQEVAQIRAFRGQLHDTVSPNSIAQNRDLPHLLPGCEFRDYRCTKGKRGTSSKAVEQIASSYTDGNVFMGSVLVVRGDEILLNKGYGKANLEKNTPNDPDTKFRRGSLTKQFAAALVLLLQQDGKLRIEDRVRKYLPDAPKSWDKITLIELLGHNSGIPEIQSDPRF